MSFTASVIIIFVLILRYFFKKMPKQFSYLLWLPVLFRFVCPFSVESSFSILRTNPYPVPLNIEYEQIPQINSGIDIFDKIVNSLLPQATPNASMNPLQAYLFVGQLIWIIGVLVLVGYGIVNFILLQKQIKNAVCQDGNIYLVQGLKNAIIMGIIHPKIYLPTDLSEQDKKYILLHLQTHIKRFDHIIKIIMKIILCTNWTNPIVWIAYILCSRDMEMSCDERVIQKVGSVQPDYAESLSALGKSKNTSGILIAFQEGAVNQRVENILEYKVPARQVVRVVSTIVLVISVILILNPTPISRRWAKGLELNDVVSIEVITTPSSPNELYYKLKEEEFAEVVALANQCKGRYINGPESLSGGRTAFYITTTDDRIHKFANSGNVYLVIDGDSYETSYKWLSSWDTNYPYGTAPESFLEKIKGEY